MKLETLLEKETMREVYQRLTDEQKEELRKRIMNDSGMSYSTFYYKLRVDSFKPLELELLKQIFQTL